MFGSAADLKARDAVQRGLLVLDSMAVLMVLAMVLLTIADVTMRKFVDKPMTGVTELVELALGGGIFLCFARCVLALCAHHHGHHR